jgi:hypothetical protein
MEPPKSPERCAIATLSNQHESRTFCPREGIELPLAVSKSVNANISDPWRWWPI